MLSGRASGSSRSSPFCAMLQEMKSFFLVLGRAGLWSSSRSRPVATVEVSACLSSSGDKASDPSGSMSSAVLVGDVDPEDAAVRVDVPGADILAVGELRRGDWGLEAGGGVVACDAFAAEWLVAVAMRGLLIALLLAVVRLL